MSEKLIDRIRAKTQELVMLLRESKDRREFQGNLWVVLTVLISSGTWTEAMGLAKLLNLHVTREWRRWISIREREKRRPPFIATSKD